MKALIGYRAREKDVVGLSIFIYLMKATKKFRQSECLVWLVVKVRFRVRFRNKSRV
jgi:hypothetical protein